MTRAALCCSLLLLSACVLPDFKKVDASDAGAKPTASALPGKACGLSSKLPRACDACIRDNCCDLAKACSQGSACGKDLLTPITPMADFSTDFDPLLGCMQQSCDTECGVSWGCVDKYSVPAAKDSYGVDVRVIDFAADPDMPLPGVSVDACQSVDPACKSGKVDSRVTDDAGKVSLSLSPTFDGFFSFSGGGYAPATMQWSEPLYRLAGFTQYLLTDSAIKALAVVTGVHQSIDEPFAPNVGHMIFRVENCLPLRYLGAMEAPRAEAADVQVSFTPNDGASPVFYTDKSGNVTLSLDATSSNAFGGAFNLPARNLTVNGIEKGSGRQVASGTVAVRSGTVGFMYLVPSTTR